MKRNRIIPKIEGLIYQPTPGEGHCLFRSVILYLGKHAGEPEDRLRETLVEHIRGNAENYRLFVPLDPKETFEQYLGALETKKEWVDELEIEALMRVHNRPIVVIESTGRIRHTLNLKRFTGNPIFVYCNARKHYDAYSLAPGYESRDQEIFSRLLESFSTYSSSSLPIPTVTLAPVPAPTAAVDIPIKAFRSKRSNFVDLGQYGSPVGISLPVLDFVASAARAEPSFSFEDKPHPSLVSYREARPVIAGLNYQAIPGDDHCFFHAVGLSVGKDYQFLRNAIADHIEDNKSLYDTVIRALGKSFEEYLAGVRDREWADHLEISVLMKVLNRPIAVIGPEGSLRDRFNADEFSGEPIFVYYNGHNHYDAYVLSDEWGGRAREVLGSLLVASDLNSSARPDRAFPFPAKAKPGGAAAGVAAADVAAADVASAFYPAAAASAGAKADLSHSSIAKIDLESVRNYVLMADGSFELKSGISHHAFTDAEDIIYRIYGEDYKLTVLRGSSNCLFDAIFYGLKYIKQSQASHPIHKISTPKELHRLVIDHIAKRSERARYYEAITDGLISCIAEEGIYILPDSLKNQLIKLPLHFKLDGKFFDDEARVKAYPFIYRYVSDSGIDNYLETVFSHENLSGNIEIQAVQELMDVNIVVINSMNESHVSFVVKPNPLIYLAFDVTHYHLLTPASDRDPVPTEFARMEASAAMEPSAAIEEATDARNDLEELRFFSANKDSETISIKGETYLAYKSVHASNGYSTIWWAARVSGLSIALMRQFKEPTDIKKAIAKVLRTCKKQYLGSVSSQIAEVIKAKQTHVFEGLLKAFVANQLKLFPMEFSTPITSAEVSAKLMQAVEDEGYEYYCNFIESRASSWVGHLEILIINKLIGLDVVLCCSDSKVIKSLTDNGFPKLYLFQQLSDHGTYEYKILRPKLEITRLFQTGSAVFSPVLSLTSKVEAEKPAKTESGTLSVDMSLRASKPTVSYSAHQSACMKLLYDHARRAVDYRARNLNQVIEIIPEKGFQKTTEESAAIEQDYRVKNKVIDHTLCIIQERIKCLRAYLNNVKFRGYILTFFELQERFNNRLDALAEFYKKTYRERLISQKGYWFDGEFWALEQKNTAREIRAREVVEGAVTILERDLREVLLPWTRFPEMYQVYAYGDRTARPRSDSDRMEDIERVQNDLREMEIIINMLEKAIEESTLKDSTVLSFDLSDPLAIQRLQLQQDQLFCDLAKLDILKERRSLIKDYQALTMPSPSSKLNSTRTPGSLKSIADSAMMGYLGGPFSPLRPSPLCSPITLQELHAQQLYLIDLQKRVAKKTFSEAVDLKKQQLFCGIDFSKIDAAHVVPLGASGIPEMEGFRHQKIDGEERNLFYAVALHLAQEHSFLRNIVAKHIECNMDEFRRVFTEKIPGRSLEEYLEALQAKEAPFGEEWPDHIELEILMRVLDQPIVVVGPDGRMSGCLDLKCFGGKPFFLYQRSPGHYDIYRPILADDEEELFKSSKGVSVWTQFDEYFHYQRKKAELIAYFEEKFSAAILPLIRGIRAWPVEGISDEAKFVLGQLSSSVCEEVELNKEFKTLVFHYEVYTGMQRRSNAELDESKRKRLRIMLDKFSALVDPADLANPANFPKSLIRYYPGLTMEQAVDLIFYGLPVNFVDEEGKTILHHALSCPFESYDLVLEGIVKHLLGRGMDVTIESKEGLLAATEICRNNPASLTESELNPAKKEIREKILELLARALSAMRLESGLEKFVSNFSAALEQEVLDYQVRGEKRKKDIWSWLYYSSKMQQERLKFVDELTALVYAMVRANYNIYEIFNGVTKRLDNAHWGILKGSTLLRAVKQIILDYSTSPVFTAAHFNLVVARKTLHETMERQYRSIVPALQAQLKTANETIARLTVDLKASEARGAAAVRAVKEEGAAAVAASEARGAAAVRAVKEEGAAAVAALEARMEAKGKAKEEKRKRRKREGRDPDESTDEEAAARPAASGMDAGVAVTRSAGLSVSGPALFGVSGGAGADVSGGGMGAAAPAPAAGGAGRS